VGLRQDELKSLMERFEEYGLDELVLSVGGTRVELTSSGKPPVVESDGPDPPGTGHEVIAPSVGIVRLGAPVGSEVSAEDEVCLLEVWTSTIQVKAGVDGTVRQHHVEEGALAEYGQVLLSIEPNRPQRAAETSSERPAAPRSSSRSA
jgi:biotin carboxyl carrier protein